jgi:hypothetical protein
MSIYTKSYEQCKKYGWKRGVAGNTPVSKKIKNKKLML